MSKLKAKLSQTKASSAETDFIILNLNEAVGISLTGEANSKCNNSGCSGTTNGQCSAGSNSTCTNNSCVDGVTFFNWGCTNKSCT